MNSFTKKKIEITLTLATGNFGNSGNNTLTISNLRTVVEVRNATSVMPEATVKIFGMKQSDMNQLSIMAWRNIGVVGVNQNKVVIKAGDASGMTVVFSGTALQAFPDFQSAPDVFFYISAKAGAYENIAPTEPTSYPGVVDVKNILQTLATKMNFAFEDNGISGTLSNPYLSGTSLEQAKTVASHANVNMCLDGDTLVCTPQGKPRVNKTAILNAKTGLVGYPTVTSTGIEFRCLFDPSVVFGGLVIIGEDDSSLKTSETNAQLQAKDPTKSPTKGKWQVCNLTHILESEKPDGAWFSQVSCTGVNYGPTKPQ